MEAVDVLDRVHGTDNPVLVDLLGKRKLHEDAGDAIVAVQLLDDLEQLPLRDGRVEVVVDRLDADLATRFLLAANVDGRGGIVADEDGGEADRRADLLDFACYLRAHLCCQRFSVHQQGGHGTRRISSSRVETARLPDEGLADGAEPARDKGVLRYYELAKKAEWQVRDLPWGDIPPIPETRGSAEKQARRRDLWRSVIMQQLQADMFAVEMAGQLFALAPHFEAKLYYTTMVQDEARHTEAWLKLADEAGGTAERDPHLDRLAAMFLDLDTLEEKVFLMQVFFERLIIPRFRMIARASRGTVLEDLCNRLTVDDGIHHSSGVRSEEHT